MQKVDKNKKFDDWMRSYYNKRATDRSSGEYEHFRWFLNKRKRRQFRFSGMSLLFHLRDINFKKCFEIGCGPGTWTKLLLKKYPKSEFKCLDLSKEMIEQFKKNVNDKNVKTVVSSFLDYKGKEKYDFVFSSRAIEYIPNKPEVIKKISDLMDEGGEGMIITSHPHPKVLAFKKMLGKKINLQHIQRISVNEMRRLLRKNGLVNIRFYPILFSDFKLVPTSFLFRKLYKKRWGLLSKMFATGYVVRFEKPQRK